jgi:hypothetical protein
MPALGLLFALFLLVVWLLYLAYRETEQDFPPAHCRLSSESGANGRAGGALQRKFALTTPQAGKTRVHSLPLSTKKKILP